MNEKSSLNTNKIIKDPFRLGINQCTRYWKFLFFAPDDIDQVVRIAVFTHNPNKNLKEFNLALNRGMYQLARDLGFVKRHVKQGPNENGQWWDRKIVSMNERELEYYDKIDRRS